MYDARVFFFLIFDCWRVKCGLGLVFLGGYGEG
jgi:hypothetical protein